MKRNTNPQFVGVPAIKEKQKEQLDLFEAWASKDEWHNFHDSHYDWWMFPIDEPSSYGYAWTVYKGDVEELKKDGAYVKNYLRGVELLALSWGWDLLKRKYIENPKLNQEWQHWPIRLYKASKSLKLFGFEEYFGSMKMFAKDLMLKGNSMEYNGRDLSLLFK
jgi:hypothetical protein